MTKSQPPAADGRSARSRPSSRGGGPARIDRAAIARAAGEIPLAELSMRSVAERLGVTVSSLYHYVAGRDELFALAAEQTVRRLAHPVDRGQHWAVWFYEWAVYIRRAFVADPGLLKQYVDGVIGVEAMAENLNAALDLCVRQGFSVSAALRTYELVSECALGSAITQIRGDHARAAGHSVDRLIRRMIVDGDRPLPQLEFLLTGGTIEQTFPFPDQITTVLLGVALQRDEDVAEIRDLLRAESRAGSERARPAP